MKKNSQDKKVEEFQIDTRTNQNLEVMRSHSSVSSNESKDAKSIPTTGFDQPSEATTINSNIVEFFQQPTRIESIEFQINENFKQDLDEMISEEDLERLQEILRKHIIDKKLEQFVDIDKLARSNNEHNYISTNNLEIILAINNPLSYFMNMSRKQGLARTQSSIKKILSQNDKELSEDFWRRITLHQALIVVLFYFRVRKGNNKIGRAEKTFICAIGQILPTDFDIALDMINSKNLIEASSVQFENIVSDITDFINDLEQGLFDKVNHDKILDRHRNYCISKNDADFYLKSYHQFKNSFKSHQKQLAKTQAQEICAQCGMMLNLIDLGKRQYFRTLPQIDNKCRGEIKFPEFSNQIKMIQNQEGQKTYKVCYSCNKIEFNPDDKEVEEDQPKCIKKISKKQQEAMLRLGHIYSRIQNFEATMYSAMHGDTSFELFNANIGLMVKNLKWRWMQVLSHDEKNRIDEAIKYLKQHNHLYRDQGLVSTYELWQQMASDKEFERLILDKQSNVRNRMFRGYIQNSFVLDLPDEEDEGLYLMPRGVSESGYDFLHIKDLKNLAVFEEYKKETRKDEILIADDIQQKVYNRQDTLALDVKRNTVFYGDKYLDEKLFPTLHFNGYGGYNSTYLEYKITFATFAKIKLLSIRPFYRHNQDYIHMAIDRKRKEQLIGFSRGFKAVNQKQHDKKLTKKDVLTHRDPLDKSTYYFAQRGSRKIVGSPQYYIARGEEAQAMVQYAQVQYGIDHPHLFITLTLDPAGENVQTINERINFNKKKYQDPLAENIAFYLKSRAAVKMIIGSDMKQGIFGRVLQHIERIEFQKRGAPHLHMIIWLEKEHAKRLSQGYAVQAIVPQTDQELKALVLKYMKHSCSEKHCELSKNNGKCKRGYPMPLSETDYVNNNDIQMYKRLTQEDRWIIPYNPMILKLMKSNCCIERMTERDSITYLTKYVTKAEPSMNINLIEKFQAEGKDMKEVLKFLKLGVISIHQSMWQICKFPMFQMSPQVIYLNISTPTQKMRLLKEDEELQKLDDEDIDIFKDGPYERYLVRPIQLESITFFEFMEKYRYCLREKDVPLYAKGHSMKSQTKGYENLIFFPRHGKVIISATKLFANDGETFFFRVYLENVPHRKYRDFHPSNKEKSYFVECIIKNLIRMNEQIDYSSKKFFWEQAKMNKKRMQQVLLQIIRDKTLSAESIESIDQQISHIQELLDDDEGLTDQLLEQSDIDPSQRNSFMEQLFNLQQTDRYFMKTFDYNQKAEKVLTLYALNQIEHNLLSQDQKMALELIFHRCFNEKRQGLFFITGGAGVGKTHLLKLLYSILFNVLKQKVVMTASTGIAAGNVYGQTIHSLFKLSGADNESNIDPLSSMQKYLQNIDFIIIDEISQLGESTFDKVQDICQRTEMRRLMRDKLFGGKNIILCGDLLQTIFTKTNPLCSGDLFLKNFEWVVLQQNFRQQGDVEFQSLLNRVRMGELQSDDIQFFNKITITQESADFKSLIINNNSQVLASSNKLKDQYNDSIRELIQTKGMDQQNEVILKAKNFKTKKNMKLLDSSKVKHQEYLASLQNNKQIKLKDSIKVHIGSQLMITRNFDINFQMSNGQLCTLIEIGPQQEYLKVFNLKTRTTQILGRHVDQMTYKQRRLQRYQFAVQEAYANTIHKVQGLSFNYLIVDCQKMFSYGQAYTAFSRITSSKNLRLLNFDTSQIKTSHYYKDMYEVRTKLWDQQKDNIAQIIQTDSKQSIVQKLKDISASFGQEILREISQKLSKVNLNIMLESNFEQLYNEEEQQGKKRQLDEVDEEVDENEEMKTEEEIEFVNTNQGKRKPSELITSSQDTVKQLNLFFSKVGNLKIQSPINEPVAQNTYPFIRWWNNSCYHDSFMHCFYFGVWRQSQFTNDQLRGLEEIVSACKTLDTFPFLQEFQQNATNRSNCERQLQSIQVLRRKFGLRNETCGNEQIKALIKQNTLFSSNVIKNNKCDVCLQSKGERIQVKSKIKLDSIVNFSIQETLDKLMSVGIQFPCESCGFESNVKSLYFISSPEILLIDINLSEITPLELNDIQVKTTTNQIRKYELTGIIAFDKELRSQHFISYLKNGVYNQQYQMKGWWRYNGIDKGRNMGYKCEDNNQLQDIMINDVLHKFIPNLLMYKISQ